MPRCSPGSICPPRDQTRPTLTANTGAWSSAPAASRPGSRSPGPARKGSGRKTTTSSRAGPGRSCGDGPAPARQICGLWSRSSTRRLKPLATALGLGGWRAAGPKADRPSVPGHRGHSGRGTARTGRHTYGELRPLGHRFQVPAGATQARPPCRTTRSRRPGLRRPDSSSDPKSLPDRGLLVNAVMPGSNAATHGLKPGDVLVAYNGIAMNTKDDQQYDESSAAICA